MIRLHIGIFEKLITDELGHFLVHFLFHIRLLKTPSSWAYKRGTGIRVGSDPITLNGWDHGYHLHSMVSNWVVGKGVVSVPQKSGVSLSFTLTSSKTKTLEIHKKKS